MKTIIAHLNGNIRFAACWRVGWLASGDAVDDDDVGVALYFTFSSHHDHQGYRFVSFGILRYCAENVCKQSGPTETSKS